jgi:SAM-dependent methyltransferase
MIEQRPPSSAPVVQGVAEALPFADRSFDVVMAILTVHHWNDIEAGLKELCRVAPRRIVLTFDAAVHARFWLMDYLPALNDVQSQRRAPSIPELMTAIEGNEILVLPVPWDCLDGMTIAYWRRPKAYLREHNHAGGSSLRQIDADARRVGLAKLRDDLDSGRWQQRYRHLLELEECDLGLRLAIGQAK